MRAAIFYIPEDDDPLLQAGASWLGRDAVRGNVLEGPSPKLACLTKIPARYGFHATLKPPMHLTADLAALTDDLARLAGQLSPFALPPLVLGYLGDALALLEAAPSVALQNLCDQCVAQLDHHRLPPSAAELARRQQVPLSAAEFAMLARWGYPYVFHCWRFHMTLTSALPAKIRVERQEWAAVHFASALGQPREVRSLALCVQPAEGGDFHLERRFGLGTAGSN